jgi:transposase
MTDTRAALEVRRLAGGAALRAGLGATKVARMCHVSRMTVYRWRAMLTQGEDGLRAREGAGRPRRLTAEQDRALIAAFHRRRRRCTTADFAEMIADRFGVHYDPDHAGRIMHRLGLRPTRGYQRKAVAA